MAEIKCHHQDSYQFSRMQRLVLALLTGLVCLTFLATNLQALLWQSSDWLVSTVLPAVVIDLTNDQRTSNALPTLQRNAVLDEAARLKAEHMAQEEYFAHFSPDGVSPWHWFRQAGYLYAHAGENLAIHFTDSAEVVDAWMKSPTHRDNIVNGQYREIGVGTARGSYEGYDTVYVVQLFGTPAMPPVAPATVAEVTPTSPTPPTPDTAFIPAAQVSGAQNTPPTSSPVEIIPPTLVTEPIPVHTAVVVPEPEATPTKVAAEPSQIEEALFEPGLPAPADVVIVTKSLIATSSGLAIASVEENITTEVSAPLASLATRPHKVLQTLYLLVAGLTLLLITWSIVHEARRLHFVQVAYSCGLLVLMGGLWYIHHTLTTGALIV